MRRASLMVMLVFLWPAAARPAPQEIDRLLASVNGKVITEGDLALARSLNAVILLGKSESAPAKAQELNRLIDLELVRQEMESFPIGQADQSAIQAEIGKQLAALKSAYAEIGGLPVLLQRLGLQEGELTDYLRLRALMTRFMNLRFRPFINDAGGENVDEKVNAAMDQWIQNMRTHARIEFFDGATQAAEKKMP